MTILQQIRELLGLSSPGCHACAHLSVHEVCVSGVHFRRRFPMKGESPLECGRKWAKAFQNSGDRTCAFREERP